MICPDFRGHGDSAWSPDGDYTPHAFAYDFAQLVHTLGYEQVTIIGHSLGGNIATMFTASDIPMELVAYGGNLNRDILGEKKEQYEEILNQGREWTTVEIIQPLLERQWLLQGILPASVEYKIIWRKAKSITPADLRDLADAGSRLKVLGVKDEIIQLLMAGYLRDVDVDILNSDGFSAEQFAQTLKGISV